MSTHADWSSQHPHRRAVGHWAAALLWMLPLLFVAVVASLAVTI